MQGKWRWIVVALAVMAACGSGEDPDVLTADESPAVERRVELGGPVESRVPPAVVPENATLDESLSQANFATYLMPEGVSESQVMAWYEEHMPKGADFKGLRWLEALPATDGFGENWYWCAGPAESVDVSFGQNDPDDGGRAFVGVALQNVSDGACEGMGRPVGLVQGTVSDLLTAHGADPVAANCTHTPLLETTPEGEVLALAGSDQATLFQLVAEAAVECDVPPDVVQAMVDAGL